MGIKKFCRFLVDISDIHFEIIKTFIVTNYYLFSFH